MFKEVESLTNIYCKIHCCNASSLTFNLLIIFSLTLLVMGQKVHNATRTDLMKCKLTQKGMEYRGSIARTVGDVRCQNWDSEEPIHEVSGDIRDQDFPERSMKAAKNYCRNPTGDIKGPWCYTLDPSLIDDVCDIPLCNFGECKLSGPGAEYGGSKETSSSGRKCRPWHKRHQLEDAKSPKFEGTNFPDRSLKKVESFCRNPTGDVGGPWCYVEQDNFEYVQKEYCDIHFCDDRDCVVLTKNVSHYGVLTKLHAPSGNATFWFKLWNPNDEKRVRLLLSSYLIAEAKVLLSLLPVPATAELIAEDWTAGVELLFANSGSRQTFPKYEDEEGFEDTPEILLGTKWTGIWITWGGGFVSAGIEGSMKPILMQEYKKKRGITSLYPETFLYYGLRGTNILWSPPFCQSYCEVYTTFGIDFSKVWAMQRHNDTEDIRFFVRASQNIHIRLYETPALEYPSVTVIIGKDVTSLTYQESEESTKHYLKEIATRGLLDFWSWREFAISIFGGHFRLFSQKTRGAIEILYMNENFFATLRWFSIGSEKTIAQWTLFCPPEEADAVEDPWPPNCVSDFRDFEYKGSQWTTINEIPCIPWISSQVQSEDKVDEKFTDGSALKALNKCRNPTHDPNGPYCYAYKPWESEPSSKYYCTIQTCRSSDCRMAGTANDYIGTLSKTRSGRTCDFWPIGPGSQSLTSTTKANVVTIPPLRLRTGNPNVFVFGSPKKSTTPKPKPAMPASVRNGRKGFNNTMYPEGSAKNASNYCRNPSRNIAGTWCYTTDPSLPRDLCNVRDCEKPEEFTYLMREDGTGRRLYVLPEYRSEGLHFALKAWEPDNPDSVSFVFTADDGFKSRYILKIGTVDNERVILFYQSETDRNDISDSSNFSDFSDFRDFSDSSDSGDFRDSRNSSNSSDSRNSSDLSDFSITIVKKKTLPHLLYMGKWTGFILRIPRGRVLLYYEDDPTPIFEWTHVDPPHCFLPMYYYYGSDMGRAVGIAFDRDSSCHIENTKTERYTRILSLSTWIQTEVVYPKEVTFHLRGKGKITIPLYLMLAIPGFYVITFNEAERQIVFSKNTYPNVVIFHKQITHVPLFLTNSWTNITIRWSGSSMEIYSNKTSVFRYRHNSPLVFYYFSIGASSDSWVTWSVNCMPTDIDGPPLDGGWSEWGPWACSVSCNGGTGTRKRRCDSPKPNVRGEPCVGPSTMSGRCNEILCGDITEDTVNLINRRIRSQHTALTVKQYEAITIESDSDIIKLISAESPRSELQWSLNGVFVQDEPGRLELKDYNVEIMMASLNHSGVYAMTLRRIDGTYSIIKVVSLAVIPSKESVQRRRETLSTTVTCHCTILGHVYSELQVSWLIENEVWKDYGITLPIAADIEHIAAVNKTHDGMWQCVVKQNDLGFEWITNMILVKVLGPPNWRTHLMEDQATRPFFGWLPNEEYVSVLAVILFVILVGGALAGSIFYIRVRESAKELLAVKKQPTTTSTTQYEPLTSDTQYEQTTDEPGDG
ncbi:uncharacterized protein LOC100884062 [Megachile rotundata]|uniref:uncharacterized protein LOC100884062 n=1 Tax=Megachile rotundata TaxID=143995 RepID=UPI003FD46E22